MFFSTLTNERIDLKLRFWIKLKKLIKANTKKVLIAVVVLAINAIKNKNENFEKNHKTVFCHLKCNVCLAKLIKAIDNKFKIPKKQINIQTSSVTKLILNIIKIKMKTNV